MSILLATRKRNLRHIGRYPRKSCGFCAILLEDGWVKSGSEPALFMLVSALMGLETMHQAYRHAIKEGYRFYSYGDSSLLLPKG